MRNYQPGLDAAQKDLPDEYRSKEKVDAENMEQVDTMIHRLRENAQLDAKYNG